MFTDKSYTVAIRTLGKSGDMLRQTILSLQEQTVSPVAIFVYIAEGYSIPERISNEKYIVCPKGMISQRALPFDEISTELILFSDDDMYYPPDAVERLLNGMSDYGGDCISANVFPNNRWSFRQKVSQGLWHGIYPSLSTRYAFRIRKSGGYSYCLYPKEIMNSQSCSGNAILVRKQVYKQIHFEDERWLDTFQYALGEDQLFAYKIFCMGYKLLIHYKAGIVHLDAGTSQLHNLSKIDYNERAIRYIIWYRTLFEPADAHKKVCYALCFYTNWFFQFMLCLVRAAMGNTMKIKNVLSSIHEAIKFIKSPDYKKIPRWPK